MYGLGETTGGLVKGPRKFTLEPRDSLGYDPTSGDGMYKVKYSETHLGVSYHSHRIDITGFAILLGL